MQGGVITVHENEQSNKNYIKKLFGKTLYIYIENEKYMFLLQLPHGTYGTGQEV